ncbi:hypothetical protein FH063_002997 [Azospirillum argentinense]|uniref:Uncharacterized protein n=1 Tax=Azospirillum argentinense TaxID=2970906 RepID=A0A5B0KNX0_9PROT|nr:type I-C CRISPR-associated protein Cas8c/Csd1 [Azospirillum argentinense]KAA1053078.1 hypothetical protein FH063_002997 [Azospirillum argentinense]
MSVLAALAAHYDRLERCHDVVPFGFTRERITFGLVLSTDGEAVACGDLRLGAKGQSHGRPMTVPRSFKRSGIKPPPFFLWDNSRYVLGLGRPAEGSEPRAYADRAAAFRDWHELLFDGIPPAGRSSRTWRSASPTSCMNSNAVAVWPNSLVWPGWPRRPLPLPRWSPTKLGFCGSERSESMWRRTTARSVLPDVSVRAAYVLTLRCGTGRSPVGPTGGSGGI